MSSDNKITFYDIASAPPLRTFAPNPWKTRFALNFKDLSYQTQWVHMPDIAAVRQGLGVPANRTLPDGSPFHTLPVLQDASNCRLIGDSFEIALYLDSAYPDGPRLFRPLSIGLTAAFNAYVDSMFTKHCGLCSEMPFDPTVEKAVAEMFAKRVESMAPELQIDERPDVMLISFEAALEELAKAYMHTGGTTDHLVRAGGTDKAHIQHTPPGREEAGPWLDGSEPVYADFIVGAWLKFMEASLRPEHWQHVRTWQGGLWGKVVDAVDKWSDIK